jgi:hypothetical protein
MVADELAPAPWRSPRTYAPVEGCRCAVCILLRGAVLPDLGRPIRPSDPEWGTLLKLGRAIP